MLNFSDIRKMKSQGDVQIIAKALKVSPHTVMAVVHEKRPDKKNIRLAFSIYFKQLEDLENILKSVNEDGQIKS